MANNKVKDIAKNVSSAIQLVTQRPTNPDIAQYRAAVAAAQNINSYDRRNLYKAYKETVRDSKVFSCLRRITLKCINTNIIFINSKGERDEAINKWLKNPLIPKFITHILEADWWGHSLVEFSIQNKELMDIQLIPRQHVKPEWGLVLVNESDREGIFFRQPPYSNYLVEIGEPHNLGVLEIVTPYAIYSRQTNVDAADFSDKTANPTYKFSYQIDNPNAKKEVEIQAADFQGSGTLVVPEGSGFDISNPSDKGMGIYQNQREYLSGSIALVLLLQTMSSENGSSRSQAEVHQEAEDDAIAAYHTMVENVFNHQLLPLLAIHGLPVQGGSFQYDDSVSQTVEEKLSIIERVQNLGIGDVPLDIIEKEVGIKLNPKATAAENTQKQNNQAPIKNFCSCCPPQPLGRLMIALISKQEEDILERLYKAKGKANFDKLLNQATQQTLLSGFDKGWKFSSKSYKSPAKLAQVLMKANILRFSTAKTLAACAELNQLITPEVSFADFKKQASPLLADNYNGRYLEAEFNLAQATADGSSSYYQALEVADALPFWRYDTVGDDRVRNEHSALDGYIFKAGEMGELTPPNGWGCRCIFTPITQDEADENSDKIVDTEAALELLPEDAYKKMDKSGFLTDRAGDAEVFTNKQMYINLNESEQLSYENYELEKYREISKNAPTANAATPTNEQGKNWFANRTNKYGQTDEDVAVVLDYNELPLLLNRSNFNSANIKWDGLPYLELLATQPDEVYYIKTGKGKYLSRYLRYFKTNPLVMEIQHDLGSQSSTISKLEFATKADEIRVGVLAKIKK